jgi:hypothetical protein
MDKLLSGRRVLLLADLGCESVTAAATVNQALAVIDAQIFDVAMLDMNLNGCNSYAVARARPCLAVRRSCPDNCVTCACRKASGLTQAEKAEYRYYDNYGSDHPNNVVHNGSLLSRAAIAKTLVIKYKRLCGVLVPKRWIYNSAG